MKPITPIQQRIYEFLLEKAKDKITNFDELLAYKEECAKKTEFQRTQLNKDKTGVRIEGISFSMQNFVSKVNSGTTSLMEGIILKLLRYDSNRPRTAQNATFMKMQWPMYALGPAIGALLYLIVISFVKDDKDERLRIEYELKQRREKARELAEKA